MLPSEPAASTRPFDPAPAPVPTISINGVPIKPSWVVPSIVTWPVIGANAAARLMVWMPVPMLNVIVSAPADAFACVIDHRRSPVLPPPPGLASVARVTSNVASR